MAGGSSGGNQGVALFASPAGAHSPSESGPDAPAYDQLGSSSLEYTRRPSPKGGAAPGSRASSRGGGSHSSTGSGATLPPLALAAFACSFASRIASFLFLFGRCMCMSNFFFGRSMSKGFGTKLKSSISSAAMKHCSSVSTA
eukprot:CAMPEP_0168506370 /NCGR_PEP_ID=MMETSP0228-20121227/77340_1 /TAXON_ID=133427 /ORGANISM="Protoceratium reticulatum, Strain CCCM 535 (=CCMP 1889)" /LENGTH=141 /DNA_ID=CAMNT_0008523463 /DNA_START=46 /DNA_END=468 /DNA_ORIENTATION=+